MNLTAQVAKYANKMATKDSTMEITQKTIIQLHGKIKTLKRKLMGQPTNKSEATSHKKFKWWSNPY